GGFETPSFRQEATPMNPRSLFIVFGLCVAVLAVAAAPSRANGGDRRSKSDRSNNGVAATFAPSTVEDRLMQEYTGGEFTGNAVVGGGYVSHRTQGATRRWTAFELRYEDPLH